MVEFKRTSLTKGIAEKYSLKILFLNQKKLSVWVLRVSFEAYNFLGIENSV